MNDLGDAWKVCVYVVDDDVLICRSIERAYGKRWNLLTETRGEEALRVLLSDEEFDVIFLDLFIPDLTGAEIYETLRRDAPARCARIVFFTAGAFNPTMETWLAKTGRDVLSKPVSLSALEKVVEKYARMSLPRGPQPMRGPEAVQDEEEDITTAIIERERRQGAPPERITALVERKHVQRASHLTQEMRDVKQLSTDIVTFMRNLTKFLEETRRLLTRIVKLAPVIAAALAAIYKSFEWMLPLLAKWIVAHAQNK